MVEEPETRDHHHRVPPSETWHAVASPSLTLARSHSRRHDPCDHHGDGGGDGGDDAASWSASLFEGRLSKSRVGL